MSDNKTSQGATVGILFPGELGAAFGRILLAGGHRVVTTLEGRSERTARLCRAARLAVLASLHDVVRTSDVVISLVSPAAADSVARRFCDVIEHQPCRPIFVDANSIAPHTAEDIAKRVVRSGCSFVDMAVHGQASRLASQGTLYLSGPAAHQIADLFRPVLKTKLLGVEPGRASAFKMLLAGMSKGLVALYFEMSAMALELGLLSELVEDYVAYYPGVMSALERLVPTYPQHAARRADEMAELCATQCRLGLRPNMSRGTQQTIAAIGALDLAAARAHMADMAWSMNEVAEAIHRLGGLHSESKTAECGAVTGRSSPQAAALLVTR